MVAIVLAALLQIELLGDDDLEVRERATVELRTAGLEAGPALMRALESPDAEVRARAEMLLDELTATISMSVVFVDERAVLRLRNDSSVRATVDSARLRLMLPDRKLEVHACGLLRPRVRLMPGQGVRIPLRWVVPERGGESDERVEVVYDGRVRAPAIRARLLGENPSMPG